MTSRFSPCKIQGYPRDIRINIQARGCFTHVSLMKSLRLIG